MTEDETIFALATVERELDGVQAQMVAAVATLRKMDKIISQQEILVNSLMGTLDSLMKAPVISLTEFRSVATGRNKAEQDLQTMRGQRREAEKLLAAIVGRETEFTDRRQQLQHQLDNPPQVVLEFKSRE